MVEVVSAVDGIVAPGRAGMPGDSGVTLTEARPFTLIQFAAWPDTLAKAGAEAARAACADSAPGPGQASTGASGTLLRVEPLKWWLIGETPRPPALAAEIGTMLDLSQSRTQLHVSGPQAARLLNHVLPLDLSEAAFPNGSVASSAFHNVGVTLWRDATEYNLFLPRSFAASLCEILTESAAQYGLEIA